MPICLGRIARVCLLSFWLLSHLFAQTGSGSIQGTVTDPSGASVPNAKVVALQIETGNSFSTVSNQAGFFIFPSAQPGRYRVTADSPGMEKWEGELQLQTGQDAVVSPVLKVGGTSTKITVAGDVTPLVTTTNPSLSSVVERARIEELPLNGRFLQNLLEVTTPGLETGIQGNRSPQAFGLRDGMVQFVQDGVQISDANITGITNRPPGMDTIQEYRVEMSVASAKYSSAVTTVISTRSGTNDWHGSLFDTGRNNGFGVARQRQDFFTKPPQYILNEYGASIGGPVRIPHLYNGKDRTFFFAAWEGYSLRSGSTFSTSVPTPAMEQGDFSQLTDNQSRPITLYDPFSTTSAAQNYSRVPYSGNIIPIGRRSPFAAYYYSVLPQANQPNINPSVSANWFGPDPTKQNDWTFTSRIDHRLGTNDQISGRYTIGDRLLVNRRTSSNTTPITSDNYWNYQADTERMQTASFTWNHIFGPTFFMETVVTGARMNWRFDLQGEDATENLGSKLGRTQSVWNRGRTQSDKPRIQPLRRGHHPAVRRYQAHHRGTELHAGVGQASVRVRLAIPADVPGCVARPAGRRRYIVRQPGHRPLRSGYGRVLQFAAANRRQRRQFLPRAWPHPTRRRCPLRSTACGRTRSPATVQDNWKIARNLTLNLGLRYDYLQPLLDTNGINAVFDFANHAIVRTASVAQLIQQGATTQAIVNSYTAIGVKFETTQQAGLSGKLINVGQLNFSPRVGLAYNWKAGEAVRGGARRIRRVPVQPGNAAVQCAAGKSAAARNGFGQHQCRGAIAGRAPQLRAAFGSDRNHRHHVRESMPSVRMPPTPFRAASASTCSLPTCPRRWRGNGT